MRVTSDEVELLNTAEAAEYVSQSEEWLAQSRRFGTGPDYVRTGRGKGLVGYTRAALDAWMAEIEA